MSAKVLAPIRGKVLHPAPIEFDLLRPKPPARGEGWTHVQIQAHVEKVLNAGFGDGAIVVHRKLNTHERKMPRNWGVVMNLHRYKAGTATAYTPLTVKCFVDDSLWFGWHEELLLIHHHYEWKELDDVFKDQLE